MRSTSNIALLALSRSQSQLSRGQLWYSGAAKKKLSPQSATPPRWSSATLKRDPRRHNLCGNEHKAIRGLSNSRCGALYGPGRHIREEQAQPLSHRRMRECDVSERRIRKACQYCCLRRGHDFAGPGTDHREAKDATIVLVDNSFHESLPLLDRLRAKHRVHGQLRDAYADSLAFRFGFTQPYVGKQGIREHAICNQPIARAPILSRQIVTNDAKIVFGYVCELWATSAFSNGPDFGRTRFQPPIHPNVTATVQPNPGLLKSDPGGIRNAPSRDEDVAAIDVLLTSSRAHDEANPLSRLPTYLEELGF